MKTCFEDSMPLSEFALWEKTRTRRVPFSFELEITARCNNNCRHCCINLPAGDRAAMDKELSLEELKEIIDEAVSLGALWGLLTGGEPLLRDDFATLYLYMKKKGLLVSVFTNAALVTEEHAALFQRYPPRDIEVSVYGVTQGTYERVTRRAGSYDTFMRGLRLLLERGVKVRLKAMALRSNLNEIPEIVRFCKDKTKDFSRIDPFLHLRYDGNVTRNEEIRAERLSPQEIAAIEASDPERREALEKHCLAGFSPNACGTGCNHLFHCGAGNESFNVSSDGLFRLCPSLWHPDCVYHLRKGTLREAWQAFIPKVREMRSDRSEFLEKCRRCLTVNLCMGCPGHSHLETGATDRPVDYFCQVARARARRMKLCP